MSDSVICAGNITHSVDTCQGDSGGPLTFFNGTHHVLVGIVSFGMSAACATFIPSGFARVSHQMEWIKRNSDDYVNSCSGRA